MAAEWLFWTTANVQSPAGAIINSFVRVCKRNKFSSPFSKAGPSPNNFLAVAFAFSVKSDNKAVLCIIAGGIGLVLFGVPGLIKPLFVHFTGIPREIIKD